MSDCSDVPMFLSNPHFLDADERLFDLIDGLKPDRQRHQSLFHFHPRVGVPLGGVFRTQFNIKVSHFRDHFKEFPEGSVLPIAFFELLLEDDWMLMKFFMCLARFADFLETFLKFLSIFGIFYSFYKICEQLLRNKRKFRYNGVKIVDD